jgi:ligand-binding sensor domain-containing protein/two-component sensor histidine kinase
MVSTQFCGQPIMAVGQPIHNLHVRAGRATPSDSDKMYCRMGWHAILLLLAAPALLRSELLPIRSFTTADGLAADRVDCIVSDSRGFLWFCTAEGLSRFDGYRFTSYGVDEGLPHRAISTVMETRTGDHFIGTARGISRISNEGAPFSTFVPDGVGGRNYVMALRESRTGKFIWCATAVGLFEWRGGSSFRRREFPLQAGVHITDLVEDPSGALWVGTNDGLFVLGNSGVAQSFSVRNGLPGGWIEMMLLDSKGRLWAATRGGLVLFSRRAEGLWVVEKAFTTKSGLVGNDVKALAEDSDGTVWIGTSLGISRLRLGADGRATFENLTRAHGLTQEWIIALAQDQAGNMWAGTAGAGVMRIDRSGFTTYGVQDGLPGDHVMAVFEDRSGELVTVSERMALSEKTSDHSGRSVNTFDGVRFRGAVPKVLGEHGSWGWDQVVLQSRTLEWWAATSQGLCRFGGMNAVDLDGKKPTTCYAYGTIFRIFEDSKGRIWASAQAPDRLMRWDPEKNAVINLPAAESDGLPWPYTGVLVGAFAEDRHGNVWLGMWPSGLYRYDGHTFRYFTEKDGVPSGRILSLLAGEEGLWIGSDAGGLGLMEDTGSEHPRIRIYSTAQGLASSTVLCIVEDLEGHVYAGTRKGVDRLDLKTGHVRHFSITNGLARGEIRAAFRDRTGSLWFGTSEGLSRLLPTRNRPPTQPPVFITDVRIGGQPYPVSQLGSARVSAAELSPSQNQLQAEFVGLDYEPGQVLRYRYKLEGADKDWSLPRDQHVVDYGALTGGKYRFLVKAVTSEGVESAAPAEIDFTVLPPVWKRWWFESLALVVGLALVFAVHRYRVAQMVSIERMRTAIASDLHDDIGASLSQIAILTEVARAGGNGHGRPGEPLERVATLARELVDSMSDIVWSIRSEPHGLDSLIRRLREFALDVLGSQGIEFDLQANEKRENVGLSLEVRRQLFLIYKESIHNAVRHSHCTSVRAELKVTDREIALTVEDNGTGFSPLDIAPDQNGGNGIPSMRRRAESLGGSLELRAEPGLGCVVSVRLPMRRGVRGKL